MRVTRASVERRCAICERTLLMGERTARFSPNGGSDFVDVCPLCQETAHEYGWLKEGAPTTLTIPEERRGRRFSLAKVLGLPPRRASEPIASEPILRRLSEGEIEMVEAADQFNASQYRRTIGGIAKSLGVPKVSVIALSGINSEVVVTVAWELSWYQYRVAPDGPQPVRLAGRGHEVDELEALFTEWNAHLEGDGRVVPDIARL